LDEEGRPSAFARSYIQEALECFNARLHRAAAVMVGAGVESTVLELRSAVVTKLTSLGVRIPAGLNDWKAATVARQTGVVLDDRKATMPHDLMRDYEAHWTGLVAEIRRVRNEAGHPAAIDAISVDVRQPA
jgi:hypothetical protein